MLTGPSLGAGAPDPIAGRGAGAPSPGLAGRRAASTTRRGPGQARAPGAPGLPDAPLEAPSGPARRAWRDWRAWLAPALVLAVAVPPLRGLWMVQGPPMEEGFMIVYPELVLEGKLPNRDFIHLYGPGSLWVLAGVFAVFGVSLYTQRVVGLLQHLALGLGVYALLRPWGRWVAAGGGAMATVVVITPHGLTALAWAGGVALALWALGAGLAAVESPPEQQARRRRMLWAAGLLAGAALLYRADLVLALALPGLVLLAALARRDRIRLVLAGAVGLSPYLFHLATAGPANVIRGMFIEPVIELRGGRSLPLPPSTDRFDGFLQGAGELYPAPWPLPHPGGPLQLSLWLMLLGALNVTLLAVGVRALRQRGDRRLLCIALLCIGLIPQALQRADSTHLAWASAVPLGVLPAAVMELARSRLRPVRRLSLAAAGAVALPVILTLALVPFFTWRNYADMTARSLGHRQVEGLIYHAGREFPYQRLDAVEALNQMLPIIDALSEPGDRLVVGTGDLRFTPYNEAFLYYLLPDLVPGTYYVHFDPGIANAPDSGLAEDIAAADVVILSSIRDDWVEPNESRVPGPDEPNRVLERYFCLHGSFGEGLFGRGLYELYLRC